MTFTIPKIRSAYTNPAVVFVTAWVATLLLYMLQYSDLLFYSRWEVFVVVSAVVVPFAAGALIASLRVAPSDDAPLALSEDSFKRVNTYLKGFAGIWIAVTLVEIIYSGGVPMLWTLTGSYKTYFDFGIPSVHGLMNALILTFVTVCTFLGLISGRRIYYLGLLFLAAWGVVVISRNLIIVALLQCLFLMFFIKGPPRGSRVLWLLVLGLVFIIGFGWIGDLRSGADAFFALAQPSPSYPTFLPSGFLWVYIYITTPLNNLVHQVIGVAPEWNWGLTNSMALLLPSVIRNIFYDAASFYKGDLVTEAFNVSTAFMDMYRDLGIPGMMVLSFLIGTISQAIYNSNSVRSILFTAILLQSAVLSIFFNHYFYLPILFQYPLIWLLPLKTGAQAQDEATA